MEADLLAQELRPRTGLVPLRLDLAVVVFDRSETGDY